jgi:hypothetical protein
MATNKTDFLKLNDWVGADQFRREEMNANFRTLDSNAKEHSDKLDAHTTQLADIAINVKSYGTKGDGVVDDTTAIQNAINSVSALGGGTVSIPKGTYKISSTITVPPKVSFIGSGTESVIRYTGTGKCIIFGDPTVTGFPSEVNAKIADIRIVGNGMNTVGTVGIYLVKSLFAVIERVFVSNMESGFILDGKELWCASNTLYDLNTSAVKFGLTLTANNGPATFGQTNHTTVVGGYFYGVEPVVAGTYGVKLIMGDSNTFLGTAVEGMDTGFHIVSNSPLGHRFFGIRTEAITSGRDIVCDNGSVRNIFVGANSNVNYNGQGSEGINTEISDMGTFPKVTSLDTAGKWNRRKIVRIEGGTGAADNIYVSRKKADETYEWASLISGGAGAANPDMTGNYITSPSGIPFKPSVTDAGVATWSFAGKAYDLFDRADSASIIGSANVGGAWTNVSGTFGILGNQAYCATNNNTEKAILPTVGTGNYTVKCDVLGTIASSSIYSIPQLVVRYIDNNNHLKVYLQNGSVRVEKLDLDVNTVLVSASGITTTDNTVYKMKVDLNGNKIIISINGVEKINFTLSGADQTKFGNAGVVGMRLAKGGTPATAAKWNNLVII